MRQADKIRRAFDFLTAKARDGQGFTRQELAEAANWTQENSNTNLSKRLRELVREEDGVLFAKAEMLKVRLSDFQDLFRQKQRLFTDYELKVTPSVLVYEFFMPLAREDRLRETLDSLFFTDTIDQRIREIGVENIREAMGLGYAYSPEQISSFVHDFVGNTIGGYSLYHVNGRFRADSLASRAEVAQRSLALGPYIVDETTAVVRFILPVEVPEVTVVQNGLFEPAQISTSASDRAEQMRWLFLNFFAEAVTHMVKKEDEIWLLETGMRSALYRWIRKE